MNGYIPQIHTHFVSPQLDCVGPREITMAFETCIFAMVAHHEEHQFRIIAGPDINGSYLVQIPLAECEAFFTDDEAEDIYRMIAADDELMGHAR
jgi:hypothetical protein